MENSLEVHGNDNISFQGVENSSINVIINKSADYKQLLDELDRLESHLADLIELGAGKTDKINQYKGEIVLKKQEIDRFKQGVVNLAEAFSKINIDTARLIKAKEYFDEGSFKEANVILKLNEIHKDQNELLLARDRKEKEINELSKQLIDNSNEYYIKAEATFLSSYLSNKFGEIFSLFKSSIKSHSGFNNNLALGNYLMSSQRFHLAEPYLMAAIDYKDEADNVQLTVLLNSLGVCLKEQSKYKEAEKFYLDSIDLQKTYVKEIDYDSIRYFAASNMNLGVLYTDSGEYSKDLFFLEKALKLIKDFPDVSNEYFDQLASCLNGLGNHYAKEENYDSDKLIPYLEEALALRRRIADIENIPYSFRVANILGNLALAYCERGNVEDAEAMLKEAIAKHEAYEAIGIFSHRPSHIRVLLNAGAFYTNYSRNKVAALYMAGRALKILTISNPVDKIKLYFMHRIRYIYAEFGEKLPF